MTQEELDALMGGDMDMDALEDEATVSDNAEEIIDESTEDNEDDNYRADATNSYPPRATDDNKVVHQLDDVTKESEEKATEIFDIIENISNELMDKESVLSENIATWEDNIALFTTLNDKFPDVESFKNALEKNQKALINAQSTIELLQDSGDQIMNIMDIMQYQDIHRQKIERVINVMRALSGYMNNLFAGKIDDDKRVASAVHLPGDNNTDVVNEDDIEALLASFGQ